MPEEQIPKDDRPEPQIEDAGEDTPRDRDAAIDQRAGGAGSNDDTPREPQAGL